MKALLVFFFISLISTTHQAAWTYDYETQWPGVCRTGEHQSPINIMTRDAVIDRHEAHLQGPLVFRGYGQVNVTAMNNGHTVKWSVTDDGPAPLLSGGPLRGNYTLLQFHLHWLSEHAIDGMKYPMEIHMVHIKTGLTLEQALTRSDGLAVVGVLAQVQTDAVYALEELMPMVPDILRLTEDDGVSRDAVIDITRLMSPEIQSYYTYHGSLTTPDCQEVVTWIVMDKPIFISDVQYKEFSKIDVGGLDNYRSLQPSNRVVYRSARSCSSMLAPSFLAIFSSLVSCLASGLTSSVKKGLCYASNIKKKVFGTELKDCKKMIGY